MLLLFFTCFFRQNLVVYTNEKKEAKEMNEKASIAMEKAKRQKEAEFLRKVRAMAAKAPNQVLEGERKEAFLNQMVDHADLEQHIAEKRGRLGR